MIETKKSIRDENYSKQYLPTINLRGQSLNNTDSFLTVQKLFSITCLNRGHRKRRNQHNTCRLHNVNSRAFPPSLRTKVAQRKP